MRRLRCGGLTSTVNLPRAALGAGTEPLATRLRVYLPATRAEKRISTAPPPSSVEKLSTEPGPDTTCGIQRPSHAMRDNSGAADSHPAGALPNLNK